MRTSVDRTSSYAGFNQHKVPEFIDLGPVYPKYCKELD